MKSVEGTDSVVAPLSSHCCNAFINSTEATLLVFKRRLLVTLIKKAIHISFVDTIISLILEPYLFLFR